MSKTIPKFLEGLPFYFDWVEYKGETVFGSINFEKSKKCNRVIVDICYCATQAMNGIVEKSVNYKAEEFKESRLTKISFSKNV